MLAKKPRPSPAAAPSKIEDDAEYTAFAARSAALDAFHARLVAAQIEAEALHPSTVPIEVLDRDIVLERARQLLAKPPAADAPLPTKLPLLLATRTIADEARKMGTQEFARVANSALHRVRAARMGEWNLICREYALGVVHLIALQRQRDAIFAEIGWSPFGRLPLPLSEFEIGVRRGSGAAGSLSLIIDAALAAGLVSKKEIL